MKKYECIIDKYIPKDFHSIRNVELYAGKKVVIRVNRYGEYRGKLPKSNNHQDYYWTKDCFSSMQEITET
jgi:hypothetical protein